MGFVKSELAVLDAIENEKRASIRKTATTTRCSFNYVWYRCNYLAGRKLISKVAPRTYELTSEGEKASA